VLSFAKNAQSNLHKCSLGEAALCAAKPGNNFNAVLTPGFRPQKHGLHPGYKTATFHTFKPPMYGCNALGMWILPNSSLVIFQAPEHCCADLTKNAQLNLHNVAWVKPRCVRRNPETILMQFYNSRVSSAKNADSTQATKLLRFTPLSHPCTVAML